VTVKLTRKATANYYLLNISNRIDAIDPDASHPPRVDGRRAYRRKYDGHDLILFDPNKIGACHAWFEMREGAYCFSDGLFTALQEVKIEGLKQTARHGLKGET